MKTTDLIPILLYHLKDGDKYGLELVNACSECSDGKITVKQPTLYSILKKLEKSKFISSYWEDSDIGGKRHYFKITENGLSQLETYPPLEDLVKMAVADDLTEIKTEAEEEKEIKPIEKVKSPSPFDNFSIEKIASVEEKKENVFDKLFATKEEVNTKENAEGIETNELLNEVDVAEEDIVEEDSEIIEETTTNKDIFDALELNETITESIDESQVTEPITHRTEPDNETPTSSFNVFDALDFGGEENDEETEQETEQPLTPPTSDFELDNPFFKGIEEKTIEEKTNLEINEENSKLLSKDTKTEDFVSNKKVSKFTEKNIAPTEISKKEIADLFSQEIKPISPIRYETEVEIKYQDYVDLKTDKNVKKIIKTSNMRLCKVLTSSIFSLAVILACFLVVLKSGFSPIFTVFSIVESLYVVYYACNFIGKFKEHRYSLGENFKYYYKKKLLFRVCLFIILAVFILIYNLVQKNNLFAFSNFGNFLSPLIISSLVFADYIFSIIFYKR